ncbi:DUF4129 domain-containing protein [Nocardia sp. CDC159]|uniref:DUF4129 domain-containing protein n=1 Tax=Nocardia pulmonis TaxID=2951408 RepID=A0A9X2IVU3_9NOCA|nr:MULTISPECIES: DUF4129 domain-containing protein [Nocardia]MCM6772854.1 DUF4129 domain-containing protein [Nocardia pulmonis]MCM6785843.1 DUF4129 domain-containing protein [Nocardia sp. CDC159]
MGTAIPRAVGAIALLALAVLALRGFVPGTGGPQAASPPSAISVALMPVLSLVSVVILLAGVISSQHRLPLAMPARDRERVRRPRQLRRWGGYLLIILALLTLFAAAVWVVRLIVPERSAPSRPPAAPATTTVESPPPAPNPFSGTPHLSGRTLVLVGGSAAILVATALAGLVTVAIASRRQSTAAPEAPAPTPAEPPVSLAEVAEMGLAAMTAPGQDAREAIIACYVAMEQGLALAREAAPLASDTPSEVLARAFDRGALHDASARELVALFEEARFSPHAMLEWQRMRAEQLLRIVLRDLQGEAVS